MQARLASLVDMKNTVFVVLLLLWVSPAHAQGFYESRSPDGDGPVQSTHRGELPVGAETDRYGRNVRSSTSRIAGSEPANSLSTPGQGDGNTAVSALPETRVGRAGETIGRVTLAGLIALDGVTTHQALARGGREVLIPSQNEVVIQSVLAAQAVGFDWALGKLGKQHPTAARNLRIVLIASRAVVVASNINQLRKAR